MAIPTVKDLIEELDEYGGHLFVKIDTGSVLEAAAERYPALRAGVDRVLAAQDPEPLALVLNDHAVDGSPTVLLEAE